MKLKPLPMLFVFLGLLLALSPACQTTSEAGALKRFRFEEEHMGAWWSITLYAPEETSARTAATAAFAKVRELDERLTDYAADSELSLLRLAELGVPVKVSPIMLDALQRSRDMARKTDGAFDFTVGPFIRLWRTARQARILPAEIEREQAAALVGWENISINTRAATVTFARAGMRLDLGGIAKGIGADAALAELKRRGFPRAMVAASGDLALGEAPPGKEGWSVGVSALDGPEGQYAKLLLLKNCGVSTSGDTEQYVTIDGVRYSHIVDPRTGIGLTNRIQATVIARDAASSDSLATAVCVQGMGQGISLLESLNGTAGLVIVAASDGQTQRASKRFEKLPVAR